MPHAHLCKRRERCAELLWARVWQPVEALRRQDVQEIDVRQQLKLCVCFYLCVF